MSDVGEHRRGPPPPKSLSFLSNYSAIPYADGEGPTPDRESITMLSSPYSTDTVDTVVHNPQHSAPTYTPSTPPHRRSLGNFEPLLAPAEPTSPPPATDGDSDEIHAEKCDENERLVNHPIEKRNQKRSHSNNRQPSFMQDSYEAGTCCYCLSRVPALVLTLWALLLIATIGWAVCTWRSIDSLEQLSIINIRTDFGYEGFAYSDMTLIVLALLTLLYSVVLLIVNSFTSRELSSHYLSTWNLNSCGSCLANTMTVTGCFAVVLWTLIVALLMIPAASLTIIHILVKTNTIDCLHLPSHGYSANKLYVSSVTTAGPGSMISNSTESSTNYSDESISVPTVEINSSTLTASLYTESSNSSGSLYTMYCGSEIDAWLDNSWHLMTPLCISLGLAIAIECIIMGFVIISSSNARYLKERRSYLSKGHTAIEVTDDKQTAPFI